MQPDKMIHRYQILESLNTLWISYKRSRSSLLGTRFVCLLVSQKVQASAIHFMAVWSPPDC
jgi:hypothetical protein